MTPKPSTLKKRAERLLIQALKRWAIQQSVFWEYAGSEAAHTLHLFRLTHTSGNAMLTVVVPADRTVDITIHPDHTPATAASVRGALT